MSKTVVHFRLVNRYFKSTASTKLQKMRVPSNTLNVIPFFYIRMPDIAEAGTWQAATERRTWGGNLFPDSAIMLKCQQNKGLIEVQDSRDANTLKTMVFRLNALVAILGNSLMFFQGDLVDTIQKSLDEIEHI